MEKIASTTELKKAIQLLEVEQRAQGAELKEQYVNAYKSFNPISLLTSTLKGAVTSPGIIENIVVGGVGLLSGYLTRKIVVGASSNIFRKLIGTALQFGTTTAVTQNSETIKSAGQLLYKLFMKKKKDRNHE
jgi:hypothetical protein